jgi:hypothetical protein
MKTYLIVAAFVAVALFPIFGIVVYAMIQQSRRAVPPKAEAIEVSLTALVKANRENPAAVVEQYTGQTLVAVGYVQAIRSEQSRGAVYVDVTGTPDWFSPGLSIWFYIGNDTTLMLAKCSVDSRVVVTFKFHASVDQRLPAMAGISIRPQN